VSNRNEQGGTLMRFQELGREREPQEEQSWGFLCVFQLNGENQRKQRTACRIRRRVPHHPEFVLECESQRIHHQRRSHRRRSPGGSAARDSDGCGGDDRPKGLSKHEPKGCYWTEGVPSEKTIGQTPAPAC